MRMIAETYSTVGRSLPLTLLNVWEKYRERWGADDGREGDAYIAVAAAFQKQD